METESDIYSNYDLGIDSNDEPDIDSNYEPEYESQTNTYSDIFSNEEIETGYKNYYKNERDKFKLKKIHSFILEQKNEGLNLQEEYLRMQPKFIEEYKNEHKNENIDDQVVNILLLEKNMYKIFSIVFDGGDSTKLNVWQKDKLNIYTNNLYIKLDNISKIWSRDEKMTEGYKNIKSLVNKIINTDFEKHLIYSKHTIVKNDLYYLYNKYKNLEYIEMICNKNAENKTLILIYKEVQQTIINIINTMRVFNDYNDLCIYKLQLPLDKDVYKLTYFNIIELELWTNRTDGLIDLMDNYSRQFFEFSFCNDMLRDLTSKNKVACSYIRYKKGSDIQEWTLGNSISNVDEIKTRIINQFVSSYGNSILSINVPEHSTIAILMIGIGILYFNTGDIEYDDVIIPILKDVCKKYNDQEFVKKNKKKIKFIKSNKTKCFEQIGPFCQSWAIFLAYLYVKNIEHLYNPDFLKEQLPKKMSSKLIKNFKLTKEKEPPLIDKIALCFDFLKTNVYNIKHYVLFQFIKQLHQVFINKRIEAQSQDYYNKFTSLPTRNEGQIDFYEEFQIPINNTISEILYGEILYGEALT